MAFVPFNPIQSRKRPTLLCRATSTCRTVPVMTATVPKTFTITKTVMPSDSDYVRFPTPFFATVSNPSQSSALWHGSYIRWLEEARVRFLTFRKLPYDELVRDHATELVVRDIRIRYTSPARLGDDISISIRMEEPNGRVRIVIHSDFIRESDGTVCASAEVTIVPIDIANGKVRRVWPDVLKDALLSDAR